MRVESSISRAITYLQATQSEAGYFDSFSSPTKQPFRPTLKYQTTFSSSLILQALSQIPEAMNVRTKLATWLLTQKNDAWSFNYWATESPERLSLPYPDDLDDTFCALIALYRHDASLIDARILGKVVRLLLATESKVGGPYRTWLVIQDTPEIWQDIDLAVNSNIAYFLQLIAQTLPNLTAFMAEHIVENQLSSPYYPSIYPLIYYLSRAYQGEATSRLIALLKRRQKAGCWGTPLRTAQAISALDELGCYDEIESAVAYLKSQQLPDGSWPAEAFCLDPAQSGQRHYNGSAALTTALVIEALQRLTNRHAYTVVAPTQPKDQLAERLQGRILNEARKQYRVLDPTLRMYITNTLERMVQGDHSREIVLLPYFFAKALRSGKPPTQLLVHLGLANLYGWTAYTIFDDFLDGVGDAQLLPVATSTMRYSLEQFQAALPDASIYQQFVRQTFNAIDSANAWEIRHCRFKVAEQQITIGELPNYGDLERLAQRSLGHTLTPLGVLVNQGTMPTDAAARRLVLSLKHYLIARQLHDDLLDWEMDMRAGQCSYVVQQLLQAIAVKPGLHDLPKLIPAMRQAFWNDIMPNTGKTLLRHAELAKQQLTRSQLFTNENDVTQLINRLHASVVEELAKHTEAQYFLSSYRAT